MNKEIIEKIVKTKRPLFTDFQIQDPPINYSEFCYNKLVELGLTDSQIIIVSGLIDVAMDIGHLIGTGKVIEQQKYMRQFHGIS